MAAAKCPAEWKMKGVNSGAGHGQPFATVIVSQ